MLKGNADTDDAVKEYYPAYKDANGNAVEAINADVAIIDQPSDEDVTANGDITWELSTAIPDTKMVTGIVDGQASNYVSQALMTIGSNLVPNNTRNINSKTMVLLKSTEKQSAAETNAVNFSINVGENYTFLVRKIHFLLSRIGTDSGNADVSWQSENGTVSLALGMELNRNKAENGWYTEYDEEINTIPAASGEQKLVINIYNVNAGKETAIGNVVISGLITSIASGIEEIEQVDAVATEYYNLQGMRVLNPNKGVFIQKETLENNKKVIRKVRF